MKRLLPNLVAALAIAVAIGAGCGSSDTKSPAGTSSDACTTLNLKCPKCTLPNLKSTCQTAVATANPASCQNGLDDADIQANCK